MVKHSFVPFKLTKALNSELIWLDENYLEDTNSTINKRNFIEHFSYVVDGNEHFNELCMVKNDQLYADAEIYRAGFNAGGARVGNFNGYQVKGIGKNQLASTHADTWHSYGGNALSDGVLEVVYSNLLQKILPIGIVKCIGLILTGEKNAFSHEVPGVLLQSRGCLLVRETCIRPAHFFLINKFKSSLDKKFKIKEPKRHKQITNDLVFALGGEQNYSKYLALFIDNCAQQFAYAKLNRIYHGAMTSSNIALNGQWLDLTRVSLGGAGRNMGSENNADILPFYTEHVAPLNFLCILINSANKYAGTSINKHEFAEIYSTKLEYYIMIYSAQLIGAYSTDSASQLHPENLENLPELKSLFWDSILSDNTDNNGELEECLRDNDPLIKILESGFLFGSENEGKLFLTVLRSAYKVNDVSCSFLSFVKICCIKSLKKAYFSQVFFRPRVIKCIEANLQNNFALKDNIDNYECLTNWLYDETLQNQVLYSNKSVTISYCSLKEHFLLSYNNKTTIFVDISNLLIQLQTLNKYEFIVNDFDFLPWLVKILKALVYIDNTLTH